MYSPFLRRLAIVIFSIAALWTLQSCLFESSEKLVILAPDFGETIFTLLPNDASSSDSLARNALKGVFADLQPGGDYELSVEVEAGDPPPRVNLYHSTPAGDGGNFISQLPFAVLSSARGEKGPVFHYVFTPEISEQEDVALRLVAADGSSYSGTPRTLQLEGEGRHSLSLSVNLIRTGLLPGWESEERLQELRDTLEQVLDSVFRSAGISLSKLRLLKAENNPVSSYPKDKEVILDIDSEFPDTLSCWNDPELEDALDLVLVSRISLDGYLGVSPMHGRSLGCGRRSTVVLAVQNSESELIFALSAIEISATAIHEIGHFLGLRHTTSTSQDLKIMGDLSAVEDGFLDTPFCPTAEIEKLFADYPVAARLSARRELDGCPDRGNLMFPVSSQEVEQFDLSEQQALTLRKNLSLYP